MKTYLGIFGAVFLAATAAAQPGQTATPNAKTQSAPMMTESIMTLKPEAPNVIKAHGVTYTGVVPQIIKSKQPLQLINPAAPAQYWANDGNADRATDGHIRGFKLLSFSF
jgi:hypothetical protein